MELLPAEDVILKIAYPQREGVQEQETYAPLVLLVTKHLLFIRWVFEPGDAPAAVGVVDSAVLYNEIFGGNAASASVFVAAGLDADGVVADVETAIVDDSVFA